MAGQFSASKADLVLIAEIDDRTEAGIKKIEDNLKQFKEKITSLYAALTHLGISTRESFVKANAALSTIHSNFGVGLRTTSKQLKDAQDAVIRRWQDAGLALKELPKHLQKVVIAQRQLEKRSTKKRSNEELLNKFGLLSTRQFQQVVDDYRKLSKSNVASAGRMLAAEKKVAAAFKQSGLSMKSVPGRIQKIITAHAEMKKANSSSTKSHGFFQDALNRFPAIFSRVVGAFISYNILQGVVNLTKKAIEVTLEFSIELDIVRSRIRGLNTDMGQVAREMNVLNKVATHVPFTFKEMAKSVTILRARGLDPTERALKTLAGTAVALDKPLEGITDAFAKLQSGSRTTERFLKPLGIGFAEFREELNRTGNANEALLNILDRNIPVLDAMNNTIPTLVKNMKTLVGQVLMPYFSPFLEGFKNAASAINDELRDMVPLTDEAAETLAAKRDFFRTQRAQAIKDIQSEEGFDPFGGLEEGLGNAYQLLDELERRWVAFQNKRKDLEQDQIAIQILNDQHRADLADLRYRYTLNKTQMETDAINAGIEKTQAFIDQQLLVDRIYLNQLKRLKGISKERVDQMDMQQEIDSIENQQAKDRRTRGDEYLAALKKRRDWEAKMLKVQALMEKDANDREMEWVDVQLAKFIQQFKDREKLQKDLDKFVEGSGKDLFDIEMRLESLRVKAISNSFDKRRKMADLEQQKAIHAIDEELSALAKMLKIAETLNDEIAAGALRKMSEALNKIKRELAAALGEVKDTIDKDEGVADRAKAIKIIRIAFDGAGIKDIETNAEIAAFAFNRVGNSLMNLSAGFAKVFGQVSTLVSNIMTTWKASDGDKALTAITSITGVADIMISARNAARALAVEVRRLEAGMEDAERALRVARGEITEIEALEEKKLAIRQKGIQMLLDMDQGFFDTLVRQHKLWGLSEQEKADRIFTILQENDAYLDSFGNKFKKNIIPIMTDLVSLEEQLLNARQEAARKASTDMTKLMEAFFDFNMIEDPTTKLNAFIMATRDFSGNLIESFMELDADARLNFALKEFNLRKDILTKFHDDIVEAEKKISEDRIDAINEAFDLQKEMLKARLGATFAVMDAALRAEFGAKLGAQTGNDRMGNRVRDEFFRKAKDIEDLRAGFMTEELLKLEKKRDIDLAKENDRLENVLTALENTLRDGLIQIGQDIISTWKVTLDFMAPMGSTGGFDNLADSMANLEDALNSLRTDGINVLIDAIGDQDDGVNEVLEEVIDSIDAQIEVMEGAGKSFTTFNDWLIADALWRKSNEGISADLVRILTDAELDDLIKGVDLKDHIISADLSDFITSANFNDHITPADLNDFLSYVDLNDHVTPADLGAFLKAVDLNDYVGRVDLTDFIKFINLNDHVLPVDLGDSVTPVDLNDYVTPISDEEQDDRDKGRGISMSSVRGGSPELITTQSVQSGGALILQGDINIVNAAGDTPEELASKIQDALNVLRRRHGSLEEASKVTFNG